MSSNLLSIILLICSVSFALCKDLNIPADLYNEMFVENSPPIERHEAFRMLRDLAQFYEHDSQKLSLIKEVLAKSEVYEGKCNESDYISDRITGRARQFLKESRKLQSDLCQDRWEAFTPAALNSLTENDKSIANSIISNMIAANKGVDFGNPLFRLPDKIAQVGVVRYLQQKTGKKISKSTGKKEFMKMYDKFVQVPFKIIYDKLDYVIDAYKEFVNNFGNYMRPLRPDLKELVKIGVTCRNLTGFGYAISTKPTGEDTWDNIFYESILSNSRYY